jgi:hypothetical protein
MTLSTTLLFFLVIILLVQGLDFIWRVPPENSWLLLLSICGHAFMTTSVLSASFIYYVKANHWVDSLHNQVTEVSQAESA